MATPAPRRAPRRAPRSGGTGDRPASGGRVRASGGDPDGEGLGYEPRRRAVRMNPIAAIALFASPLVLVIIIGVLYVQKQANTPPPPAPEESDHDLAYKQLKGKIKEAHKRYLAAAQLKEADDQELFNKKVDEAMDYVSNLLDEFDRILEPVRQEDGDVPPEYNGYMQEYGKLQQWAQDLSRIGGF